MSEETKQTGFNAWVQDFGCAMTDGLNRNAQKGGRENWLKADPRDLLLATMQQLAALTEAMKESASRDVVWAKAASVANMAAMAADAYANGPAKP